MNHKDGASQLWVVLQDSDGVALVATPTRELGQMVPLEVDPFTVAVVAGCVWLSTKDRDEVITIGSTSEPPQAVIIGLTQLDVLGVAGQVWVTGHRSGRPTTLHVDPVTLVATPVQVEGRPLCGSDRGLLLTEDMWKDCIRVSYLDIASGARSTVIEADVRGFSLVDDQVFVTYWEQGKAMLASVPAGASVDKRNSVELPGLEDPGRVVPTAAGIVTRGLRMTSVYPKGGPHGSDILYRVDWPTRRITASLDIERSATMAVVGEELWISQPYRRRLVVIDPATMSEVATVDLPGQPWALAVEAP